MEMFRSPGQHRFNEGAVGNDEGLLREKSRGVLLGFCMPHNKKYYRRMDITVQLRFHK
jgi:hypothetical protein